MKKLIITALFVSLSSCADMPISFGLEANGVNASYSSKGGLVIGLQPAILVENSGK